MRRKRPAVESTSFEKLKQLFGQPTDGLVQVVQSINIMTMESPDAPVQQQQQQLSAQHDQQHSAVTIKVLWVPDQQGQLRPYQLLPDSRQALSGDDCSSINLLLTQLIDMQQQQQLCAVKQLEFREEEQATLSDPSQYKESDHQQQQQTAAASSQLQGQPTQLVNSSSATLRSAIAAATAAAAAAATKSFKPHQDCCRHCAATHALLWVWQSHNKLGSCNDGTKRYRQSYLLCHSCAEYMKARGSRRCCKDMPSAKLEAPVPPRVAAAALTAASKALAANKQGDVILAVREKATAAGLHVCSSCWCCDIAHATGEQSLVQQQQQQWLCDACRTYLKLTGNTRPICPAVAVGNATRTAELLAAWRGLLLYQDQQQQQQQQRARKRQGQDTVQAPTAKRPAVGDRKPPRPLVPSNKQQRQQQQQPPPKSKGRGAATKSSNTLDGSTNGLVSATTNRCNNKPVAAEAAATAAGNKSSGGSNGNGCVVTGSSIKPPKFKELKRNVFAFRQRGTAEESDGAVCGCDPSKGQRCREEDGCLNRMCKVSCTPGCCPVGDDACTNMTLLNRKFPASRLSNLGAKDWGLLAGEDIAKGTIVAEYTGEVIPVCEGRRRLSQYASEGLRHTYIMDLSNSEVIDATKKGGIARFINHSCDPNCKTEKWQVGREVVVAIVAIKAISVGTELTYDYRYQSHALPHARTRCRCGSASCSGWLGSFDPHAHLQAELEEQEEEEEMINRTHVE